MHSYTVEFVELKNGKKPFFEFLKKLKDDDVVKIFARIDFFILKKIIKRVFQINFQNILKMEYLR